MRVVAAGLHLLAWLSDGADEHAAAMRARRADVGAHELPLYNPRASNPSAPPGSAAYWLDRLRRHQARSRWCHRRTRFTRSAAIGLVS
ncbi:MAG: hypothetical protein JOY82_21860 [Streptosporangiaceae bacterium]|nr:hypothetical protein [Streptosporangiaceae bacterium]